jgi:hypothetical protein
MVNLTYRAERALLGALLRDPASLNDIPFLTAGDFASEQHGEVFHAIAAAHARPLDDSPAPFEFAVAFSNSPPGISVRYLQSLSEACPDPANANAYARMVMESSLRRQLLAHADRLFRDAGNLHFEVGRFTKVAAPGNGVQEFPTHLLKLAHAMWTHARTFDPGTEIPDGRQPAVEPQETVRNATAPSPITATEAAAEQQAHQEEEVLADLIQHCRQNSTVPDWLPAAAFTAGTRREVYEAVAALARDGRPIDELTVEWHLASSRAARQPRPDLTQADAGTGPPTWTDVLGYVGLLAALPVADGVATMTGLALLERHTRAQASAQVAEASPAAGIVEPADPPGRQRQQAARALQYGVPVTTPPQSYGAAPARPPDLLEPPPGRLRQPGPQPRP